MTALIPVISDTGPLSYLHKLGRLDVLRQLYGRLLVPPAVVAELGVGHRLGKDLPDVAALEWIELRAPSADSLKEIEGLGAGETESRSRRASRSRAGSPVDLRVPPGTARPGGRPAARR
ncbi:MAG: hypothetical protein IPK82_08015 [Polyangiaceae bacterium]|nr:hypothetical protein [Polyangiaceae bacterium]